MQEPPSYKKSLQYRFKTEISQITTKHNLSQLVLVLDPESSFLLTNIFTINDLVAMKIIYIERLDKKRKKLNQHAVYFINPTKNYVEMLVRDFPEIGVNDVPQYRRIHILFTTFVDASLLKEIALHRGLLKRIAKKSIKQFYFSTRVLADNLLDLSLPYLSLAFSKQSPQEQILRQLIPKKLTQLLSSTPSLNTIRIFYKKSPNRVCQRIAQSLDKAVKNYLTILLQNGSPSLNQDACDLVFLVLDRSVDTVTPFLHCFTYEALLFDLFGVQMVGKGDLQDKGMVSYEEIQNSVYDQYRYQHLSEALAKIPEALEDQKGKLQMLKSSPTNIDLRQLTQRISQYKSNIERLQQIWKQFQSQNIQEIADLEQSIATGITSNSENTSSVKLIADVIQLCKKDTITKNQKLRLALLLVSCIKMSKDDYETLVGMFGNDDKKVIKNMIALGVSYDGSVSKSTKTVTKDQQKIAQKRMQKTGMPLNRYTSIVQLVLPLFCQILSDPLHSQTIDKDVFGEFTCSVFPNDAGIKFQKNRFAVAMMGGISWAEVSAIRMMPELEGAVIMADSIMNPDQFLKEIAKINVLGI